MAKSRRKTLKQYSIGCGLLVLFVIVVLAGLTGWVFLGYREAFAVRERLEQAHDTQDEFTPPTTGDIPRDRLQRFLAVREALKPLCEKVSAHQRLFARLEGYGDAERPPFGAFLRDGFRAATSMLRVGRDYGDYVTARNEALLAEDMGLGEYTWIYVAAYRSWLGHQPVEAIASESRPNVFFDRVFPQVREMIRRHVAAAGDGPTGAAWRAELEALDRDRQRIPFEDALPPEIESSLSPFRDELERLACPAAGELEVVLTVRSGVGFDHR
jgi:hypothetical protein